MSLKQLSCAHQMSKLLHLRLNNAAKELRVNSTEFFFILSSLNLHIFPCKKLIMTIFAVSVLLQALVCVELLFPLLPNQRDKAAPN